MRVVTLLSAGIALLAITTVPLFAAAAQTPAAPAAAAPIQPPTGPGEVGPRAELQNVTGVKAWRVNGEEIPADVVRDRAFMTYGPFVLQDLVVEKLLLQEAKRRGVTVTDAEVEAKVKQIREEQGLGSDETFSRYLRVKQATPEAFRAWAREYVYIEKLFADQVFVSDQEVAASYRENQQLYHIPETVVYRLIMVPSDAAAQQALAQLRQGKDFAVLAKELATTPAEKAFGGEPQTYQRAQSGNMPKDLEDALFKAPLNQLTGPLQLGGVYVLFKVEKRSDAHDLTLDQVKDQLKKDLRRMKLEQVVFPGWLSAQLQAAEIVAIPASGASPAK